MIPASVFNNRLEFLRWLGKRPLIPRALALAVAVLYPYLCFLGGSPRFDEGMYAWEALSYHYSLTHDLPLPPIQGLAFWSLLLSWIPELPGLPLIWFRLADLSAALLAGWFFCAAMQKECGSFSALIGFVFLLCLTHNLVIDNGFKNSFFPAWACFFAAVSLGLAPDAARARGVWYGVGALVALGILLRETFFPFAALGLIAVYLIGGVGAAGRYALGGVAVALLTAVAIELAAPGSLASLYKGYADRVQVYQSQTARMIANFRSYALGSALLFWPATFLSLFIIAAALRLRSTLKADGAPEDRVALPRAKIIFWLCVALIPLYETLVKISFYYHFAAALPGLACLTALFAGYARSRLKFLSSDQRRKYALFTLAVALIAGLGSLKNLPSPTGLARTVSVLKLLKEYRWPDYEIAKSVPLQVVDFLRKNLPPGATLSVNGVVWYLFPASGRTPPMEGWFDPDDNTRLADLGRFYMRLNGDGERLKKALLANPPDAIVLIEPLGDHEPSYSPELKEIMRETGLYEKIGAVDPRDPDNQATEGVWFAYEIFRRKPGPTDQARAPAEPTAP